MRKRFLSRYYFYFIATVACLLLSIAVRRIEPLVLATPFCITLILSLSSPKAPKFHLTVSWEKTIGFENEEFNCVLSVTAKSDLPMLEVFGVLPPGSTATKGTNDIFTSMARGESRAFAFSFAIPARGIHRVGQVAVRVHHAPALRSWDMVQSRRQDCVVYPLPDSATTNFRPFYTQVYTGNYVSRSVGEGIEFADVRPLLPGEIPRRINWRSSARAGSIVVNEFAVERNADVVLLLDTFVDLGIYGQTFLDQAARGAATVAHHFIQQKNRVGLIEFGYYLSYVVPKPGLRQWYDIADRLSRMTVHKRHVSYKVATIPRKILPPRALVLAFTTFFDLRFHEALVDLKGRGFDVVAIHVSPAQVQERALRSTGRTRRIEQAAIRMWRLENIAQVEQVQAYGIPIVQWDLDRPFLQVLRSLEMMRRRRMA